MKTDNELIAEFMNLHVAMHGPVLYLSDEDGYIDFTGDAEPYCPNKSWNQLMLVVKKIYEISDPDMRELFDDLFELRITSGKSTVYNGVIEFIKWHNQQKQ